MNFQQSQSLNIKKHAKHRLAWAPMFVYFLFLCLVEHV